MRSVFPGQFRPKDDVLAALWGDCIFAVDANVLLNVYRYSPETRRELEQTLRSVGDRLFIPHQAAKEFLKNRLAVTAEQAEEYEKIIKKLNDISNILSNKKKHPVLSGVELASLTALLPSIVRQLDSQRLVLMKRLTDDEILHSIEEIFDGKTGLPYSDEDMKNLISQGEKRYENRQPPGYMDGNKDKSGDVYRKYGDLIIWQQLIQKAKNESKSLVLITYDKKEDWWLEQSGRTIGPRPELREEFFLQTSREFWMYTVDRFMEESATRNNTKLTDDVIAEIKEISEDSRVDPPKPVVVSITPDSLKPWRIISRKKIVDELQEYLSTNNVEDVSRNKFLFQHLSSRGYDTTEAERLLTNLIKRGEIIKIEKKKYGNLTIRPIITRIRLPREDDPF